LIDITEIANEKITLEKIDYLLSKKVTQKIFDFDNSMNSFVGCSSLGTGHLD